MLSMIKNNPFLKWILLALAIAGFAAAVVSLQGQANAQKTASGQAQADTTFACIAITSQSNDAQAKTITAADPSVRIDWKKDASLANKMTSIEKSYKDALAKAKAEADANGTVSDATRSKGLKLAADYQAAAKCSRLFCFSPLRLR